MKSMKYISEFVLFKLCNEIYLTVVSYFQASIFSPGCPRHSIALQNHDLKYQLFIHSVQATMLTGQRTVSQHM